MLFNSFEFTIFFLIITLCFFLLPYRWRLWLLLAGSYYFYMRWEWAFIFLIIGQTLINYFCGLKIAENMDKAQRAFWLAPALIASLSTLFFFKYYNFANDSIKVVFQAMGVSYLIPHLNIILPVGISFYTFQALGYTIDVYLNRCQVERNFGRFALFVSFFPQLVAGPIERSGNLLKQFKQEKQFDFHRLCEGGKLIVWGLFKKVVIADRLAIYVNSVYANPDYYSGVSLALATYFFAFQIYCDFSGYSDIAIGAARIMGYDLMQNFRLPYLAESIADFWQRWHISLSTWFRDYLYIPLGGNQIGAGRWLINIYAVFLISGLWHGAQWTFVVWGGLHGTFYMLESFAGRIQNKYLPGLFDSNYAIKAIKIITTFHLVVFAWIFFRAGSVSDAWLIIHRIFTGPFLPFFPGSSQLTTLISICLIGSLLLVQLLQYHGKLSLYFSPSQLCQKIRWTGYLGMILGIALLGKSSSEFIYFQF